MSDLEKVMERLLSDALFASALARDPEAALAGYSLRAEDRELLGVPLVSGSGPDRTVEMRTTKSSMAGLLGPVAAVFQAQGGGVVGSAPDSNTFGYAPRAGVPVGDAAGATETFGTMDATETFGVASHTDTMGLAPAAPPPSDYATRVDVDGDGTWDAHTVVERPDGGVDVYADMNNDGVPDFVGHDDNRDGLIDWAEYDTDNDGIMDTRMYDDNGDGWMDRSERIPPPGGQTLGPAPGQH